jgi:hypothetical protein
VTDENRKLAASNERPEDNGQCLSKEAEDLGPMRLGTFSVGFVDSIVGQGGVEVPKFVATQNEILQLVRYWASEIIDLDFDYFLYGCTGSSEWRTRQFANRRLNTISKFIGKAEVKNAFKQAEQEFGNKVDQRAWKIFTEGNKEERERWRQEVEEELASGIQKNRT